MIKFRAWDKENKLMNIVGGIKFDGDEVWEICFPGDCWIDASNYVLMQSTGLFDKNGVEIFEGDVIGSEDINAHYWKVSLHQIVKQDCGLMGKQICSNGSFIGIEHWTTGKNPFVVLGNIHEHPHFLEKENEG